MKLYVSLLTALSLTATAAAGQGLREVPQRFAYVQPIGLAIGVGYAGLEFAVGRHTSIEIGGIGVYSREDGIEVYGGGPGAGIRRYFGEGELAGFVVGARADAVWLQGDNTDADRRFLTTALRERDSSLFAGLGILLGYRVVTPGGFFFEPGASYEVLIGPRPLVSGSQELQDELGFSVGVGFGFAW